MDSEWFVHTIYAWTMSFAQDQESRDQIHAELLAEPPQAMNTKRERARKFRELMNKG